MNKTADSDLQKQYQEYFHKKMKDHGIDGLGDLEEGKLKEFFSDVSSGWDKGKGPKKSSTAATVADRLANIANGLRGIAEKK